MNGFVFMLRSRTLVDGARSMRSVVAWRLGV